MIKFVVKKNKFGNFEIGIKDKDWATKEDIWANMSVRFRKGIEPLADRQEIYVGEKDWWFKAYRKKDGSTMPYIFVNGWYPNDDKPTETQEKKDDFGINNDDLPF